MQRNVSTVELHPVGTPRNLLVLLLADAKKRLDCTNSPYRHTAKFTRVAARRCKASRLYRLTMRTPRNFYVLLLADAKKRLDWTDSPYAHREIYMCCCSQMQRNVSTVPTPHDGHSAKFSRVAARRCKEASRLDRFTIGTPRNLHVLLLADARNVSTVQTHHGHSAKFLCDAAHR